VPSRVLEMLLEAVMEEGTVGQPGQGVVRRAMSELRDRLDTLRDVVQRYQDGTDTGLVKQIDDASLRPDVVAALPPKPDR
jgi:hypothetical protein